MKSIENVDSDNLIKEEFLKFWNFITVKSGELTNYQKYEITVTTSQSGLQMKKTLEISLKNYMNNDIICFISKNSLLKYFKSFYKCFNFVYLKNKSTNMLYIHYSLLLVSINNIKNVYCKGKKVFFSRFQSKKKSFSLKFQRRLSHELNSLFQEEL
ncbi:MULTISPECIES: hypothetical protein [Methanobacterium]|uniref:Uncharacterized protein n=1 Tax=Methanobacterium veterum TaxID=408577 RepID=A0A9E5A8W5_9EURY|nr:MULTISPECIES: hypothetical protein [Methanobacterium]MCZ3373773.1 hypothetical protein [Methanobacterium veterum]